MQHNYFILCSAEGDFVLVVEVKSITLTGIIVRTNSCKVLTQKTRTLHINMFTSTNFTVTSEVIIDINRITLSSQRTNQVTHMHTHTHTHNFTIQNEPSLQSRPDKTTNE